MRGFVLPLAAVDTESLTAATTSCSASGVSIQTVSPSQYDDARFWNQLADVHDAARDGWPDPDPGGEVTSTDPLSLRRMLMPSDDSAIAFLIASRGDQFVGYSLLSRRRDSGEPQFASTAVRPSMRSQNIATALRARCILLARESGFGAVRSASGNAALIRINARFGFQETYSEVRLVRRLR
jgi:GNAT superfamily N-acetyltransferase